MTGSEQRGQRATGADGALAHGRGSPRRLLAAHAREELVEVVDDPHHATVAHVTRFHPSGFSEP
jgi:hypothetical protein